MRRSIRSIKYVQGDRQAQAEPASDGFADFGSLDGLEAAIGRAELAAARTGQTRVADSAVERGFLPAASASVGPEFDSNRQAQASLHDLLAHPSGCSAAAKLAELAQVQQRHTRALAKIMELVRRRSRKTMDAAGHQPFEFGP